MLKNHRTAQIQGINSSPESKQQSGVNTVAEMNLYKRHQDEEIKNLQEEVIKIVESQREEFDAAERQNHEQIENLKVEVKRLKEEKDAVARLKDEEILRLKGEVARLKNATARIKDKQIEGMREEFKQLEEQNNITARIKDEEIQYLRGKLKEFNDQSYVDEEVRFQREKVKKLQQEVTTLFEINEANKHDKCERIKNETESPNVVSNKLLLSPQQVDTDFQPISHLTELEVTGKGRDGVSDKVDTAEEHESEKMERNKSEHKSLQKHFKYSF